MICKYLGEEVKRVPRPCCKSEMIYYKCNKTNIVVRSLNCQNCVFKNNIETKTDMIKPDYLQTEQEVMVYLNSLPFTERSRHEYRKSQQELEKTVSDN